MKQVLQQFCFDGEPVACELFGNGHINRTYRVVCENGNEYILQRVSQVAFHHPEQLIENIDAVTAHIAGKPELHQQTLHLIETKDGKKFYIAPDGEFWRAYSYISGGICLEAPRTPQDFYEAAVAFGAFQLALADFPPQRLHETIPHFHDTADRFRQLRESVAADTAGRVKDVQPELDFLFAREEELCTLCRMQAAGELPLRVTHNDTKLNNVLFDPESGKAICVLDLDTVMPGLSACDFGDAIRFGASTAAEDEQELDRVTIDLDMYRAFLRGYLDACGSALTEKEIEVLPLSAKVITGEIGLRFLKDHIDGDIYFGIHRPGQNLDRAHTQLRLVSEMEKKWDEMQNILHEVTGK